MLGFGRKKPAMRPAPMPAPAPTQYGMVGQDDPALGYQGGMDPEAQAMPVDQPPRPMPEIGNPQDLYQPPPPSGNPQDLASMVAQGQPIPGPPPENPWQTAVQSAIQQAPQPGTLGALNTPPPGQNFFDTLKSRGGGFAGGAPVGQTGKGNAMGAMMQPYGGGTVGSAIGGAMRGMFGGGGRGGGMGRLGDLMMKRKMQSQPMGQMAPAAAPPMAPPVQ